MEHTYILKNVPAFKITFPCKLVEFLNSLPVYFLILKPSVVIISDYFEDSEGPTIPELRIGFESVLQT